MKLYRIAAHGWAGTQADAKATAKDQGALWRPVEVPTDKPTLLAWLNDEANFPLHLPLDPDGEHAAKRELAEEQLSGAPDEGRFWEVGPHTKDPPRVSPAFLGDLKSQAEFVPISKSAAIAASYGACPKCQRKWTAQVLSGIATASIDELQLIAESIKRHVGELREGIEEGTRQ